MRLFCYLLIVGCAFRLGFCDPNAVPNANKYIPEVFSLLSKNKKFGSKTVEVTTSEVSILEKDKTVTNNDTVDFDLKRGVYKIVSVCINPESSLSSHHTVIVGDQSNAYMRQEWKPSTWYQFPIIPGVENRIHALLSEMQFTTSPKIKELSRTFTDYIHLYSKTDQPGKLSQYVYALNGLSSRVGFSISTDTHQAHCVVDESGLITHLDLEIEEPNFSQRYTLDIKVAQDQSIAFPR